MDFFVALEKRCREAGSLLCVGLDPRPKAAGADGAREIVSINKRIIQGTASEAAAFKPNIAFYEALGIPGMEALEESISLIPKGIPVILDAKRGDIGPTAEAYAQAAFGHFRADAITLSPYMGRDSVDPFLKWEGKGVFLLARTSNPAAKAIQDRLDAATGEPFYLSVARECSSWTERAGLVVAGNDCTALELIRKALPATWFLSPGIGAQGGDAFTAIKAGIRSDGLGVLINASRSICEAADPAAAAASFNAQIRDAVKAALGR